jgi:hypothetical protein
MKTLCKTLQDSVSSTLYATLSCTNRYVILHQPLRYLAPTGYVEWLHRHVQLF